MEDEPLSFEYPPMTQPDPTGTACLTMQVGKMNDSPASFSKEQQLLLQQKQRQQEQLRQQALLQQQQNQLALQQKQQQLLQQHQQQQERARKEAQAKQARPSVTAPIAQGVHQMAITVKQQVTKPSNVIYPPSIEDFVYISDMTYNRDQVIRVEKELLHKQQNNSLIMELSELFFALSVPLEP